MQAANMKKYLWLVWVAGCVVLPSSLSSFAQEEAKPQMKIPVREYNKGVVQKGDKVKYDFVVKNVGDATLNILQVRPACGCTVAEFDKEIAPGEEGKISAAVDTRSFSYGEQVKTISVKTDDAVEPNVSLRISVVVSAYIRVLPNDRVVFSARKGYGDEKKLVLHAEDDEEEPFEVKSATTDTEYVEVSYEKTKEHVVQVEPNVIARRDDYILTVKLSPETPVGYITGRSIIVKTTHEKMPEVKINLSARVTAPTTDDAASKAKTPPSQAKPAQQAKPPSQVKPVQQAKPPLQAKPDQQAKPQ
jgi:hypothetical protein